jgi:hypothetical protein
MHTNTKKVLFHLIAVAGVAAGSIGAASADEWRPGFYRDFHADRSGRFERGDHEFDHRFDRGYGHLDGWARERFEGFRGPVERFREPLGGLKR